MVTHSSILTRGGVKSEAQYYPHLVLMLKPGRVFCFTWNNPSYVPEFPSGTKFIFQKERGHGTPEDPEGTVHYQGYCEFPKVQTLTSLKKLNCGIHWENRKKSRQEAYDYCKKEDTRIEDPVFNFSPERIVGGGLRSDLAAARKLIYACSLWSDVTHCEELDEVRAKYPKWTRETWQTKAIPLLEGVTLKLWQLDLEQMVLKPPHPRHIVWITDQVGNRGKSWMAKYLCSNHKAQVFSGGKSTDVAYALDNPHIVVWDLSRTQEEHVNYGIMEDVKNGLVFSPKYESGLKCFPTPHVIVFSNFAWPEGKFSVDRKMVISLD